MIDWIKWNLNSVNNNNNNSYKKTLKEFTALSIALRKSSSKLLVMVIAKSFLDYAVAVLPTHRGLVSAGIEKTYQTNSLCVVDKVFQSKIFESDELSHLSANKGSGVYA